MTANRQVRVLRLSVALIPLLFTLHDAAGIYINPDATIPFGNHPAVGSVGRAGGAFNCTGSILENRLRRPMPTGYVLTAGHCSFPFGGTPYTDAQGMYRITGGGATLANTSAIRRYPLWVQDGGLRNGDLSLFRFDNAPAAFTNVTPLQLLRNTTLNQNDMPTLVGLGSGNGTGHGTKRQATFTMNAPAGGLITYPTAAGGPHPCGGDSGGPYLKNGAVAAVHTGASQGQQCNGAAGTGTANLVDGRTIAQDADVVRKVNWIDSYTQIGIYWDRLVLDSGPVGGGGNMLTESFENNPNQNIPTGWSLANLAHPVLGPITSGGWRYFDSIGTTNAGAPELYIDGSRGLAEVRTTGGRSILARTIDFNPGAQASATLTVEQRWNSLMAAIDIGVSHPDSGGIQWLGLQTSAAGNLDQWLTRTLNIDSLIPGNDNAITVYLLNAPEPASAALVMCGATGLLRRRRGNR